MSRRSNREKKRAPGVAPSIQAGLKSFTEGNEALLEEMLAESSGKTPLEKLLNCMHVNSLSAEMVLARFFDKSVLSEYAVLRLGKSGKGSASTLAARIAGEWAKPSFVPQPLASKAAIEAEPLSTKKRKAVANTPAPGGMVEAVEMAVKAADQGDYPLELDSIWLCVLSLEQSRANLMPLLKATQGGVNSFTEKRAYKKYCQVIVDDSDGCNETNDAFMSLQRAHKTPSAAIPDFVARAVAAGTISADDSNDFVRMWSCWLKGYRWSALSGEFVRAHEIPNCAEKSLPMKKGLTLARYTWTSPSEADFTESLGMECKDRKTDAAFRNSFVKVWASDKSISSEDVAELVSLACEKTLSK
jgi:hypothetical protein